MRIEDRPTREEWPFDERIFIVISVGADFFLLILISFWPLSYIETEAERMSYSSLKPLFSLN